MTGKKRAMGVEPNENGQLSNHKSINPDVGAANASATQFPPIAADQELQIVMDYWDALPAEIRKAIVDLAKIRVTAVNKT